MCLHFCRNLHIMAGSWKKSLSDDESFSIEIALAQESKIRVNLMVNDDIVIAPGTTTFLHDMTWHIRRFIKRPYEKLTCPRTRFVNRGYARWVDPAKMSRHRRILQRAREIRLLDFFNSSARCMLLRKNGRRKVYKTRFTGK